MLVAVSACAFIRLIKELVYCHDAGAVENLMHHYANDSSSKSELMVFCFPAEICSKSEIQQKF